MFLLPLRQTVHSFSILQSTDILQSSFPASVPRLVGAPRLLQQQNFCTCISVSCQGCLLCTGTTHGNNSGGGSGGCGELGGEPGNRAGSDSLSDSVSSLTHGVWQRNPLQPRVRFGLSAEGQDISAAIPHIGGRAFPGQSFVLYQVLYIHTLPAARAILDIHAGCSCTHVTSWAKLCYGGKKQSLCLPVSMEKFSPGLSCRGRKECAKVIVQ